MKVYYPELMGSDALGWIDGRKARSLQSTARAVRDDAEKRLKPLGKLVTYAYVGRDDWRIDDLIRSRRVNL
jgi:hypothetical protein